MSAIPNNRRPRSFYEADARARIAGLLDPGSFREFVGPRQRAMSPHLAQLDQPGAFDDGIVVGEGRLDGRTVLIAAQQGQFMGGAVGEVHGAKLTGLLQRAVATRPAAVLLLPDTGGVRLHEANAGLIALSEIMRATLDALSDGRSAVHEVALPSLDRSFGAGVGRNDPCPCGSGKKFKRCHGA